MLADFAQRLPHTVYLIPPSINPLAEKSSALPLCRVLETCKRFEVDPDRPLMQQVLRFDCPKDPRSA